MIIGISGKIGSGKDTVGKIIQYLTTSNEARQNYSLQDWLNSNDLNGRDFSWKIKKFAGKTTSSYKEITGVDYHSLPKELKEKERERYKAFAQGCKPIFGEDVWVNALLVDYYPTGKFRWAKSIGDLHYGAGNNTLCGKPMLGNNYANYLIEGERNICPDCYDKSLPNWLITDVRFENEAQAILDKGGILIRLERKPAFWNDNEWTDEMIEWHKNQHPSETSLDDYKGFKYTIQNNKLIEDLFISVRQILLSEGIL